MSATTSLRQPLREAGTDEPAFVRLLLVGVALTFLTLFLFTPLAFVFVQAFRKGVGVYLYGAGTTGNKVQGNKIGTAAAGTAALANADGVRIDNGAAANVIGTDGDGGWQRER